MQHNVRFLCSKMFLVGVLSSTIVMGLIARVYIDQAAPRVGLTSAVIDVATAMYLVLSGTIIMLSRAMKRWGLYNMFAKLLRYGLVLDAIVAAHLITAILTKDPKITAYALVWSFASYPAYMMDVWGNAQKICRTQP